MLQENSESESVRNQQQRHYYRQLEERMRLPTAPPMVWRDWPGRKHCSSYRGPALCVWRCRRASCSLWFCYESLLELRDQSRQGSRLFIRGEVTARQPLDLEAECAQSFLREVDLPVFKRIFVAAAHDEWELIAISLEEVTEVEP